MKKSDVRMILNLASKVIESAKVVLVEQKEKQALAEFNNSRQAVPEVSAVVEPDNLKAILLQCVKDAAEVIRDSGIQLGNDELQKLATTLFIARSKGY